MFDASRLTQPLRFTLALLAALSFDPTPASALPGLAHHWSFDEGKDWHDDSFDATSEADLTTDLVTGAQAALVGMDSSAWVSGRQYSGLAFDGLDDHLDVGSDLVPLLGGTATLSAWISTTSTGSTVGYFSPGIVGVEVANSVDDIQWAWIDTEGRVALSVGDTVVVRSPRAVNDGQWHHVVLARDEASGQGWLWLDGSLEDTGFGPTGTITSSFSSLGRIENAGAALHFEGRLDQVHLLDRVIDTSTVETLFDNHAPKIWSSSFQGPNDESWLTDDLRFHAYDPERDELSVWSYEQPQSASVVLSEGASFSITPGPGQPNDESFAVVLTDGNGGFYQSNVKLEFVPSEDPGSSELRSASFTNLEEILADGSSTGFSGWRTPRLIDWEQDGDLDLLVCSGGSVWLLENIGHPTSPQFSDPIPVEADGSSISLGLYSTIALADLTGDGVTDLAAVNADRHLLVFENLSLPSQPPSYAEAKMLLDTDGNTLVLPDQRFDLSDLDQDGLTDLVIGTFQSEMRLYRGTGHPADLRFDAGTWTVLEASAYNLYPRVFDLFRTGRPDLVRGINWGTIDYWVDAKVEAMLGPSDGALSITDANSVSVDLHALVDGAIPDFGDLDGDGVLDLVIGGHAGSPGVFWARARPRSFAESLAEIETIYDGFPSSLGSALDANDQELLEILKTETRNLVFHARAGGPAEDHQHLEELSSHVARYAFLQLDVPVDTTTHHHAPSIAGQNLMIAHQLGPDTDSHRMTVADAFGLEGLQREIYLASGLHLGTNQLATRGQLESVLEFMSWEPRALFPDSAVSLDRYFGDEREGWVDVFDGAKNTFGCCEGQHADEWAPDLKSAFEGFLEPGSWAGNGFTFVLGHEATHSLDAYVRSLENEDLERRWGQVLVDAAGPDVMAGANGWIDWNATKDHFLAMGLWSGQPADWQEDWEAYWTTGPGSAWRHLSFMRGSIDWFLNSPQESLATQANQHWSHSEARLIGAIDRFRRGRELGLVPLESNLSEVLLFLDLLSGGLSKIPLYDTRGVLEPYPHAEYRIDHAWLNRDDRGRIVSVEIGPRRYDFTADEAGRVLDVASNVTVVRPDRFVVESAVPLVLPILENDIVLHSGQSPADFDSYQEPNHGSLEDLGDGTLLYRPAPGHLGADRFTYTVGGTSAEVELVVGGLAGWWKLDEGAGTAAYDASGWGSTGALQGGSWSPEGVDGGSLELDGVTDEIRLGTGPSLSGTTDFTVSVWVRTAATSAGVLVQQRDPGGFNGQYRVHVNGDGTVQFMVYRNGYQFDFATTLSVNDGHWHHVAAIRKGLDGRIYVDGVLAASNPNSPSTVAVLDETIGVGIGRDIRDATWSFEGSLDDVRIYGVALAESEVLQLVEQAIYGEPSFSDGFETGDTSAWM